MKVYEVKGSFGLDSLTLVERPMPHPGRGQVLVQVRACSLNYRDLLVIKGLYNPKLRLPLVPFSDGAGQVAEIGEGVTRVKKGDRVAGIFMQQWLAGEVTDAKAKSALGGGSRAGSDGASDGMLAEYVVLNEEGLVHVPEHLSDEEAATLPCAAVTAWNALVATGGLQAGESVLTQGTGGVSLFALQFARLTGARVIAISSSDEKLRRARDLGASDGINYKTTPDWDKRVRELTGDAGVDHVVEVGGAGTLGRSLKAVRMGGHIALIGVLSGAGEVNPMPILMKHVRVQGIYVGSRDMFEAMNRAIALHQLRPVVDRVFPFDQACEALRYMETGRHFGKICVRVG
jgi:NADPH:quinone reductase-like Zn-dependent oxidoreductase